MTRLTQNLPHGINIAEESPRDIDGICHVNQTAFQIIMKQTWLSA